MTRNRRADLAAAGIALFGLWLFHLGNILTDSKAGTR